MAAGVKWKPSAVSGAPPPTSAAGRSTSPRSRRDATASRSRTTPTPDAGQGSAFAPCAKREARVFFGTVARARVPRHAEARPLAPEGIGAAMLANTATPAAQSRTICLESAARKSSIRPRRRGGSPEAETALRGGRAARYLVDRGRPVRLSWVAEGRLRARPRPDSENPRLVRASKPKGPGPASRVAEGRERGELLRVVRDRPAASSRLYYWVTLPRPTVLSLPAAVHVAWK